jgi:hypothetical protein
MLVADLGRPQHGLILLPMQPLIDAISGADSAAPKSAVIV